MGQAVLSSDAPLSSGLSATSVRPTRGEAAAIAIGVVSFLSQGVLPLLLGLTEAAGLTDGAGIGLAASTENLAMTLVAGAAGVFLPPRHLKRTATGATLLLVAANLTILFLATQAAFIAARGLAGIAEGLLFWIALGAIARSRLAERAAASLVIGSTIAGFVLTLGFKLMASAGWGVRVDFALLAAASFGGLLLVPFTPDRYAPLGEASRVGGMPSFRGAAALLAAMLFNAAGMGFAVYLVPLARSAGLDSDAIAASALLALLVGQFTGSVLAAAVAGRASYRAMLGLSAVTYAVTWPIYASHPSAAVFLALNFVLGVVTFFAIPFLYPFAVDADPTRRAAVLSGPAQMLGSAVGPFAAAAVADGTPFPLLALGFALLGAAMLLIVLLSRTATTAAVAGGH